MTTPDTKEPRDVRKAKKETRVVSQLVARPDGSRVKQDDYLDLLNALDSANAENQRLQTVITNLHSVEEKHRETANVQFHRANRLQAENQRLRRALKEIRVASTEEFWECGSIARAALAQKGDRP